MPGDGGAFVVLSSSSLASYANWGVLSRQLMLAALSSGGAAQAGDDAAPPATDDALLQQFLQHLVDSIPTEYTVLQKAVFGGPPVAGGSDGAGSLQPAMHAKCVSSAAGVVCFGGMQIGQLAAKRTRNEASWVNEQRPWGQQPDYSKVYQAVPSQPSRQVVRVEPSSSSSSGGGGGSGTWRARPCSPALTTGLLGHSVALLGSRAFIFGGMRAALADDDTGRVVQRPCNVLQAYAVDEAGTQGGLLPVLTEAVPQFGDIPSSRTYHSAAIDPEGGALYVYGGVMVRQLDGSRGPADSEAGLVHAYCFHTYTWQRISTQGSQRPRSTTLLAFFWHDGALWAIPDLPLTHSSGRASGGGGSSSGAPPAGRAASGPTTSSSCCYQLFRLDVAAREWQLVQTQGDGPGQRQDACAVFVPRSRELLVYGGRTTHSPSSLLADLHVLQLGQQPPRWRAEQPRLLAQPQAHSGAGGGAQQPQQPPQQQQQQQRGMLPLAGHAGAVVGSDGGGGEVAFVGGYSRLDKQPQPVLQVVAKGVKPATPGAARLAGAADQQRQLALQHVRLQLARLTKQAHPQQVVLRPQGGGGVKLPVKLLSLWSSLFDDLFQGMLQQQEEEDDGDSGGEGSGGGAQGNQQQQQQQQQVLEVPVPGVDLEAITAVCRWMMGLLLLGSCGTDLLMEMYRAADRLIIQQLMLEVTQELGGRRLTPAQAAAAAALTGSTQPPVAGPGMMLEALRGAGRGRGARRVGWQAPRGG